MTRPLTTTEIDRIKGKAFARRWREARHPHFHAPPVCSRCEGTQLVQWCGKRGQGGRQGPCPKCRVAAAKQFCLQLALEKFA